jgi:hypothetical protein
MLLAVELAGCFVAGAVSSLVAVAVLGRWYIRRRMRGGLLL